MSFTIADLTKQINEGKINTYDEFKTYYQQIKIVKNKEELVKLLIEKDLRHLYGPYLRDVHTNKIRLSVKNAVYQDVILKNIKSVFDKDILIKIILTNPTLENIDPIILPYFVPIQKVYQSYSSSYTNVFYNFLTELVKLLNNKDTYNNPSQTENLKTFMEYYIKNENYFLYDQNYIIASITDTCIFYRELVDLFINHMLKKNVPIVDRAHINYSFFSENSLSNIEQKIYLYEQIIPHLQFKYPIHLKQKKPLSPTFFKDLQIDLQDIKTNELDDLVRGLNAHPDDERDNAVLLSYLNVDFYKDTLINTNEEFKIISIHFNDEMTYIIMFANFIKLIHSKQKSIMNQIKIRQGSKFHELFNSLPMNGQEIKDNLNTFLSNEVIKNYYNELDKNYYNELDKKYIEVILEYWYSKLIELKPFIEPFLIKSPPMIHHTFETYYKSDIERIQKQNKVIGEENIYTDIIFNREYNTILTNINKKYKDFLNTPDQINHLTPLAYAIIFQNVEAVRALITTSAVFEKQSTVGKRRIYYDHILDCISIEELAYMTKNQEIISLIDEKMNLMRRWKNYKIEDTIREKQQFIKELEAKQPLTDKEQQLLADLKSIYTNRPIQLIKKRLINENNTYYHQTNPEVASLIVNAPINEYWFLAGSEGMYGAGIYFAKTPEETTYKAHFTGDILKGTVFLGIPYMIHNHEEQKEFSHIYKNLNSDLLHHTLKLKGYDSVIVVRKEPARIKETFMSSGNEYIVYNTEQVIDVKPVDKQQQRVTIGGNNESLINKLRNKPTWLDGIIKHETINNTDLGKRWLLETTPLMIACAQGKVNIVKQLINEETLKDVDAFGRNALFYAIQGGNKEIVQLLMNQGIDIFKQDSYGKFAVEYFSVKKHFTFSNDDVIVKDVDMTYRDIVLNEFHKKYKSIYKLSERRAVEQVKQRRAVSDSKLKLPKLKVTNLTINDFKNDMDVNNYNNQVIQKTKRPRSQSNNNSRSSISVKKEKIRTSSQSTFDPNNMVYGGKK